MADEPKLIVAENITPPTPEVPPVVEVVVNETAQQAYAKLGLPRMPPVAPQSPIKAAYQLKNNRVEVICEDGNRIWFTPGVPQGDEELQADYLDFLERGGTLHKQGTT